MERGEVQLALSEGSPCEFTTGAYYKGRFLTTQATHSWVAQLTNSLGWVCRTPGRRRCWQQHARDLWLASPRPTAEIRVSVFVLTSAAAMAADRKKDSILCFSWVTP
eukprot:1185608-Prorocentrum_minimum.AAC.4